MIIDTLNSLNQTDVLIFPVLNNKERETTVAKICKKTGVNAEMVAGTFSAKAKEVLHFFSNKRQHKRVILLGLGENPSSQEVITAFRSLFFKEKKKFEGACVVDLSHSGLSAFAEYVANGISLAEYEIGTLKTSEKPKDFFTQNGQVSFLVNASSDQKVKTAIKKGLHLAESQKGILKLVDAPANYKIPQQIADYVQSSGEENGFSVRIMDEKECEQVGLHALLAVGKGSVESPARFVIMEYKPKNINGELKTIGLIGKGVTFDTGGISLKPGEGMEYMKSDMGGAGAVIGAIEVAAKQQMQVHLIGITPLTENCIDSLAVKPGDVIQSYSGKTIEVINTDAEGRLILADALAYMVKNYKAEVIIDLATLTGSCIRTLGYVAAGLMTNNDKLSAELEKAGHATGEKLWRLPLWDDYKSEMDSDIADIKNLSTAPLAGATTAGKFLEFFTENHPKWAHLDIAGTAFGNSEFGKGKSATAYGVRLLVEFMESYVR